MTSLQNYITTKEQEINESLAQVAERQRQLQDLQQKLRIEQQLHQAQKTAETEVSKQFNNLKKLFKDLCGIYPVEAIDDLVQDIQEMAEEVRESYDEYAESGRFLNGSEGEEAENNSTLTEAKDFPMIAEALPDVEDDTTVLTSSQIEGLLNSKEDKIHNFLKRQLGISGKVKRLSVLAEKIAAQQLTRKRLEDLITAGELIQTRPLALNGYAASTKT